MRKRVLITVLTLVALTAIAVPAAEATPPVSDSLELTLGLYDEATTAACGKQVSADVSGLLEAHLYFAADGTVARQVERFRGWITWSTRNGGKSYSSSIANTTVIEFPEGVGYLNPVRITVTGTHGGVFPIGGGPAGAGALVYDGFIWSPPGKGEFVLWAAEGDPISMSGNFEVATQRLCDALA